MRYTILLFLFFIVGLLASCQSDKYVDAGNLPANVTFTEHIAPILYKNCTECHHQGGAAPFALMDYKDVKKRAKTIWKVTEERFMPPYPADNTYITFADEKKLTDNEIAIIKKWYEQGAKEGEVNHLPQKPVYTYESSLGKPDYIAKIDKPFIVKGDNRDKFMMVKIPYELPKDTFIRAFEFVPGNRKLVHHVNGHLVMYENDKKKNIYAGERYVDTELYSDKEAYQLLDVLNDDGTYPERIPLVCNYLPGAEPVIYPGGIGGYKIKKKGIILINDLHYGPSAKDDLDQSSINFFFMDKPPVRPTIELQMGTLGISDIIPKLEIPPNEVKTFTTRSKVLGDISLLTVNPHMHLIGKTFKAYAITPDGKEIPLVRIKNWDFRWQYYYNYKHPLYLPKGTEIVVEASFDNTSKNPNNPFSPPRLIAERDGSMRTTDEMLQFIFTFVPYMPGDENLSLERKK